MNVLLRSFGRSRGQARLAHTGLRQEKCLALIRSLPKWCARTSCRPDYVERAVKGLEYERPLAERSPALFRLTGVRVDPSFKENARQSPAHEHQGRWRDEVLGAGRDIAALRRTFAGTKGSDAGHKHR